MHFSSRTDIEAPIEFVFETLSDFEGWERAALRRGADVSRIDKLKMPGPGMAWNGRFRFRGKPREIEIQLTEIERNARMAFAAASTMFQATIEAELVRLAANRTRLVAHLTVKPMTLGARLVLQSVKLAKGKAQHRLNKRMAQLAAELEQRYASTRNPRF